MISSKDSNLPKDLSIPSLLNDITSIDPKTQYAGLLGFKKLFLSNSSLSFKDNVINSGAVPPLIQRMQSQSDIEIQITAAQCLANLCSGSREQLQTLVDCGAIPGFMSALKSQNEGLEEQSLLGLACIGQDMIKFRDQILHCGVIEEIVKILQGTTNENVKMYGIVALNCLCIGNPVPEPALILKGIPLLCHYLQNESNAETLENVGFALVSVSKNKEIMDCIRNCKVSPDLVNLLGNSDTSVLSASLELVNNIVTGTEEQAAVILQEKELIPALLKLTESVSQRIRKQVCVIVGNITKGPSSQAELVMGNYEFVKKLISMTENEKDIAKEAIFALVNATKNCIPAQAIRLLEMGVFECLLRKIETKDDQLLLEVLEGIGNCLKWGKEFQLLDELGQNRFWVEIGRVQILYRIEELQAHSNKKIGEKVTQIITNYLPYEQ